MIIVKLQVKNLHKSYGNLQVISNFNIDFSSDGIHCLFGPSGCGKTTLINTLVGLCSYEKGNIIGFKDKRISYIFQEDRLLPWATIEENIKFVLENIEKRKIDEIVDKYLSLVDLIDFKKCYPNELSGGMRQRVSIARAFAYDGDILIMDEPFKGLHFDIKKVLIDYIIDYWYEKKNVVIYITHDIDEVLYMANHIHVLSGIPLKIQKQFTIDIPHNDRDDVNTMNKYRLLLV